MFKSNLAVTACSILFGVADLTLLLVGCYIDILVYRSWFVGAILFVIYLFSKQFIYYQNLWIIDSKQLFIFALGLTMVNTILLNRANYFTLLPLVIFIQGISSGLFAKLELNKLKHYTQIYALALLCSLPLIIIYLLSNLFLELISIYSVACATCILLFFAFLRSKEETRLVIRPNFTHQLTELKLRKNNLKIVTGSIFILILISASFESLITYQNSLVSICLTLVGVGFFYSLTKQFFNKQFTWSVAAILILIYSFIRDFLPYLLSLIAVTVILLIVAGIIATANKHADNQQK